MSNEINQTNESEIECPIRLNYQSSNGRLDLKMRTPLDQATTYHGKRFIRVKKSQGIFNPVLISVVLISYIIFNQSMVTIMSAGKNLTNSKWNDKHERGRSLVSLVAADPSPAPSPSSGRSATSTSHRGPPINGSIFGKRSINNKPIPKVSEERDNQQVQQSLTSPALPKIDYKDIITEVIEDFLSRNNENNPEETTVAFCRMIVLECSEMLSAREKALAAKKRRTLKYKLRGSIR